MLDRGALSLTVNGDVPDPEELVRVAGQQPGHLGAHDAAPEQRDQEQNEARPAHTESAPIMPPG